jgi:dTDP-4-amino-4,6-dideoxygalactose transaminase
LEINIVRPFHPAAHDVMADFERCLSSGLVTNNSIHVRTFEQELGSFFSAAQTPVVFCNGEMALFHLIQAWRQVITKDPTESFDVLVPSFTFAGTVNAIVLNNLRPVFCDVDGTLTLDFRKVGPPPAGVKMICPVGAYGNLPNLTALSDYAAEHQLAVVLDNAPAFGAKFEGKYPCAYGMSEIISFHATKVVSSMEGGAAIVNNVNLGESLRQLRDFGQFEKTRGDVNYPGLNSKMQEISAIVGLRNLRRTEEIMSRRRPTIDKYREFFGECERRGWLSNMVVQDNVFCPYLYYPVMTAKEATPFVDFMQKCGIGVRRYYTAVHTLKYFRNRYPELNLEHTESIKDRIVSLPLHTVMSDAEIDYLFQSVKRFFL